MNIYSQVAFLKATTRTPGHQALKQRPKTVPICIGTLNLRSAFRAGRIAAGGQPDKCGHGTGDEHYDDIVLESGRKKAMPVVSADSAHEEAQSRKQPGHQSAWGRQWTHLFPDQRNEVGGRRCCDGGQEPDMHRKDHVLASPGLSQAHSRFPDPGRGEILLLDGIWAGSDFQNNTSRPVPPIPRMRRVSEAVL
jgi:hypothetical protein